MHTRFVDEEGWQNQKPILRPLMPWFIAPFLLPHIRKSQREKIVSHSKTDIDKMHAEAISAVDEIAAQLGAKPFLFGDSAHVADCSAWAMS